MLNGRQSASEVERGGLRLQLHKQQAEAGDIVLLDGDESEALTHPYLARHLGLPSLDPAALGLVAAPKTAHRISEAALRG
jgi:hypothetical protein